MKRNTIVYFMAYGLSLLGNGVASVLFPLLVLAKTGDILAAGVIASATAAVSAVVGVLAGVVIDRVNRRTVSIVSDILSAASIAALPLVDHLWGLNLTWFIVLGIIGAFGDIPGMTARETMLPRLVELDGGAKAGRLDRLVGIREALAAVLMLVGPGAGGLLVALLGVSSATLLITATTSLGAALVTFGISAAAGAVNPEGSNATENNKVKKVFADLWSGWRFLLSNRLILGASILTAVFVAVIAGLQATVLPAYFIAQGLPELSGFAVTGIALGSLVGASVYAATIARTSPRRWFIFGAIGTGIGFGILGTLGAPWLVIVAAVVIGIANSPMSAVLGVATIRATPDAMRGRVLGAQNALMLAAPALTAAPIAANAQAFGLNTAGSCIAIAVAITTVAAIFTPAFRDLDAHAGGPSGGPSDAPSDTMEAPRQGED
ncbi:MAG: MFS transporter [Corynebacterium flavescens]|uniref:MFS transporter n=1 Tax=Corynebacterium flavescens TaxID=28028 RepID=UPI00264901E9|nr:MFS transporter [Corynebacterium flavescens]MDN6552911.1 MFS transporter [Corynebacterium flavescens]